MSAAPPGPMTSPARPSPRAAAPASSADRDLVWELPFWLGLAVWALLPSSLTPWTVFFTVPISSRDLSLLALSAYYFAQMIRTRGTAPLVRGWHRGLPRVFLVLILFAVASLGWSSVGPSDRGPMFYTALNTLAAFGLGYALVAGRSPRSVEGLLTRLAFAMAGISLVYLSESLFEFGLRSKEGSIIYDFGMQRVRGPLYGAATGHFLLLPSLGLVLNRLLQREKHRKALSLAALLALLLTLIGLGSRAALLCFAVFVVLVLIMLKDARKKVIAMVIVSALSVCAATTIFTRATSDRLIDLSDDSRSDTYLAAWEIVKASGSWSLLGSGYGSIWPWYRADVEDGGVEVNGLKGTWTPYGWILYHPHSLPLLLGVELGLVGLVFFVMIWQVLVRLVLQGRGSRSADLFVCGVAASGFAMFFDLPLFKSWPVATLWWIFVLGGLAVTAQPSGRRPSPGPSDRKASAAT